MQRVAPLATREVRWFFEGRSTDHPSLRRWFETTDPFQKGPTIPPPVWKGRLDDEPDIYLLIPGGDDMGIKWREGQLQVKGRVADLGIQVFCGRHQGHVERWVKWSYPDLPGSYQRVFGVSPSSGVRTVAVRKTRALRKVRLNPLTAGAEEVNETMPVERGLGFELTELEVRGRTYCSLGFEAFPDDAAMGAAFSQTLIALLEGLTAVDLDATRSQSYPQWLGGGGAKGNSLREAGP